MIKTKSKQFILLGEAKIMKDYLTISNKKYKSRLIVGTGKYKNFGECVKAIELSGTEIVTVAVRRVNISDKKKTITNGLYRSKKNNLFT